MHAIAHLVEVAVSIPDGVTGIFFSHNLAGRAQLLTEMSTRNISWGKGNRCIGLTTLSPSWFSNSWSAQGLSRPLQGYGNRIRHPLPLCHLNFLSLASMYTDFAVTAQSAGLLPGILHYPCALPVLHLTCVVCSTVPLGARSISNVKGQAFYGIEWSSVSANRRVIRKSIKQRVPPLVLFLTHSLP